MSILTNIENAVVTTFDDVEGWVIDIAKGVEVGEEYLQKGLNYIVSQTPAIDAIVQDIETTFEEIAAVNPGFAQNAVATQAIADVNKVAAALNAMANTANAGGNTAAALTSAYVALQTAQAAGASAKAAVINAATTPASTAPAA